MVFRSPLCFVGGCLVLSTIIVGCSSSPPSTPSGECPPQPVQPLLFNAVKFVPLLQEGQITETNVINSNQSLGYSFLGKPQQIIQWSTTENLCMWLYGPDHQLLSTAQLPQEGLYTLQLSSLQGTTSFELNLQLDSLSGQNSMANPVVGSSGLEGNSDRSVAEQFVYDYYDLLNQGDYEGAWNLLTPSFQRDEALHPEGLTSYRKWWQQVNFTNLVKTELKTQTPNDAIVEVSLVYSKDNGEKVFQNLEFFLVWSPKENQWLLFQTKVL